jgi:hypothetical protein
MRFTGFGKHLVQVLDTLTSGPFHMRRYRRQITELHPTSSLLKGDMGEGSSLEGDLNFEGSYALPQRRTTHQRPRSHWAPAH